MKITRWSIVDEQARTRDLPVTAAQMDEMALPPPQRRNIQDIFPQLTAAEREFIKTGITQDQWDELFGPDEEDDQ